MRVLLVVLGVIVLLGGVVWALQGAGFILGSIMSNDPKWLWIGTITAIVGLGILVWGIWTRAATKNV